MSIRGRTAEGPIGTDGRRRCADPTAGGGVWSGAADGSIREWAVTGDYQCLRVVEGADRISALVPIGDTVRPPPVHVE